MLLLFVLAAVAGGVAPLPKLPAPTTITILYDAFGGA